MAQSVSFNFRILRDDGSRLRGADVVAVLRYFLAHRVEPPGVRIEAVNWRTPKGRTGAPVSAADARAAMLDHFYYILRTADFHRLRVGAVKGDKEL